MAFSVDYATNSRLRDILYNDKKSTIRNNSKPLADLTIDSCKQANFEIGTTILVKNQVDKRYNGIYKVKQLHTNEKPYILQRILENYDSILSGGILVKKGRRNAGKIFYVDLPCNKKIVLGQTRLTFCEAKLSTDYLDKLLNSMVKDDELLNLKKLIRQNEQNSYKQEYFEAVITPTNFSGNTKLKLLAQTSRKMSSEKLITIDDDNCIHFMSNGFYSLRACVHFKANDCPTTVSLYLVQNGQLIDVNTIDTVPNGVTYSCRLDTPVILHDPEILELYVSVNGGSVEVGKYYLYVIKT